MEFLWTDEAKQNLAALDRPIQNRIAEKMRWFAGQKDSLSFAERLTGMQGQFRFRVGAYRIFVQPDGTVIAVLRIKKRSEAYR